MLTASLLIAIAAPAICAKDNAVYEVKNGLTCENVWLFSRNGGDWNKDNVPLSEDADRARTATILGDKIYVGYSHKIMVGDDMNSGSAHLQVYDIFTGKCDGTIQCTIDGKTIDALLASNQVGTDDYGHLWFCGYREHLNFEGAVRPIDVYVVDDLSTGACSLAFSVSLPDDEADADARTDYYDLVGDVTGKEAGTVFMSVSCENANGPYIYGWRRDQGSTKWEPHMSDGGYYSQIAQDTYPAGQTSWDYCSSIYICRDEDHSGRLFYVDGFTTQPALYDTEGSMLECFASAQDCAPDDNGCNGIVEFNIAGDDYIAFPIAQYDKGSCQVRVAKLGPEMSFEGMESCWVIPDGGLGTMSDGGLRIHSLQTKKVTDANGKEGIYLMEYKANNGIGVYLIAQEGFEADNGGVSTVAADADSGLPAEYFNMQGIRVASDALVPGLYIVRQGKDAGKIIVR